MAKDIALEVYKKDIEYTIKYLSFDEGDLIEAMHAVFGGDE